MKFISEKTISKFVAARVSDQKTVRIQILVVVASIFPKSCASTKVHAINHNTLLSSLLFSLDYCAYWS
jgi:hypothetical protein